ncbi:MAG: hypothetical protein AUH78_24550 [Gemmatimonadetes bacterium 13_1_40CM_4_69_8]|nr:MAG: hypothetical protein AUH41_13290 [Gemmatimonadetes bacterium 13_1_40CM_66_11]OLC69180.1 MAG: hypothetical protein AUH78_24550 [Gemmatimonadetes bacterium 13_1_40CM_4_69_8]OLD13554.1 MAG: hypothetical protein AUJ01_15090 [Acidobacteria bacterium 13_1_40CM_3_65_5]
MRTPAIILVAFALGASGQLAAQRRENSGFWYSLGLAPGWARVTCSICAGSRRTGGSAFVGLGGRTSRSLRIGGEFAAWRERHNGVTQTLMSIGATAYWYPNLRRRLYLRGGAALVMHRASDGTDVVTSSGIGPQMGVGYEYRVGRAWALAPFVHYSVGVFGGDVKFNGGEAASSATVSFFQVGASLTRR